jgi:restriction endonuclease S subunit
MMNEFKLSDGIDKDKIFLLNFSDLDSRYDPKYNKYLQKYQQTFKASFGIGELLTKKPMYGANERAVTYNGNCRYIRITDIDEFGLLKNTGLKSAKFENMKYQLKFNDILFARSGATVGKTYIHKDKSLNAIFAGYMIRFKIDDKKVSPDYIFIYTQLNIYKEWVRAIQRSTGQPNINAEEYQNLNVPIPPKNIQQDVINIMDNTYIQKKQKEKQAKDLLDSIDIYLLDELGITLPKIDNSLEKRIFEISLSEISEKRFDPFYYKYCTDVMKSIKYEEFDVIELANIQKGQSITSRDIIKGDYDVIAGGKSSPYSHNQYNFKGNVITISASGAYSGYAWYHTNYIFASDCNIIQSKDENKITTIFIFEILKLKQTELYNLQQGSGQPHVYADDIKKIKIPLPPIEKQNEMAEHIQKIIDTAKQLKTEAVQDLKNAKLEVEKMILGQ